MQLAGLAAARPASRADRRDTPHERLQALAVMHVRTRDTDRQWQPGPFGTWATTHFRRWSNAFAHARVDGLKLSAEDRVVYQQVLDAEFDQRWAAYLEHRSLHPAGAGPGMPLSERLARVTGGDLPADRVFHPVVDLRDETTVAPLLAGESAEDRQAVAPVRRHPHVGAPQSARVHSRGGA
ncbi:hypothetical protein AR457_00935 [Streptomyces agglomeratus]|nr:hypothetical protein AR457_00935 [Streptomyces agglomeratus]OEJ62554.1 hypothetical protein BGM19_35750 [Streptomyces agglomeratus]